MSDDQVFAAIASPVRRALLDELRGAPLAVNRIAENFEMSRPAVSQHLRVLREAGLVVERRIGRERHYSLEARPLRYVEHWLGGYEQFWQQRLRALDQLLDDAH